MKTWVHEYITGKEKTDSALLVQAWGNRWNLENSKNQGNNDIFSNNKKILNLK